MEEGQYIHDFGEGGNTCNQAHVFPESFSYSCEALLVMRSSCHCEGFDAFLDMKGCKNRADTICS